jgi:hypothetical protein
MGNRFAPDPPETVEESDGSKDDMTHSLDGFAQFLHLIHHNLAARCVVSVIALVSIWVVLLMVEYAFCD